MITREIIHSCAHPGAYERGLEISREDKVHDLEITHEFDMICGEARVEGTDDTEYSVVVLYNDKEDSFVNYTCECPAIDAYDGLCKHCVAVALKMMEHRQRYGENGTDSAVLKLIYEGSMREKARYMQPMGAGMVRLVPTLLEEQGWAVSFKIGIDRLYVLKDISEFVEAVRLKKRVDYGKKLGFIHEKGIFTEESGRLVDFLMDSVGEDEEILRRFFNYNYSYYASSMRIRETLKLTPGRLVDLAEALVGSRLSVEGKRGTYEVLVTEADPVLSMEVLEDDKGDARLVLPEIKAFKGRNRICVLQGSCLYLCSREYSEQMGGICTLAEPEKEKSLHISKRDLKAFCSSVLPALEDYTFLKTPDSLRSYLPEPCRIVIRLDKEDHLITGLLVSEYGETQCNLLEDVPIEGLYRDIAKEQAALRVAMEYFMGTDRERGLLVQSEEDADALYKLASTGIAQLQQVGEVYVSDALKNLRIVPAPGITVGVSFQSGLLDVRIHSDWMGPEELYLLLESYRRRKKYHRLPNGEFIELEENALAALAELSEGLGAGVKELTEGYIQVPEYRSFYIDQVLHENGGGISINRSQDFKAFIREMKSVEDSDFEIPEGLRTELRPYQKLGYRWLRTLERMGFGGILADDMGLGKTVQVITFLLSKVREGKEDLRCLVVCPASLVYNWENEILRFADGLTAETVVSTPAKRKKRIRDSQAHVLLTSYELLKRDAEEYAAKTFDYMIIDEAQSIKNHTTQIAQAVKTVKARCRFALTGTPIENSLSELWSIFDFLMPGILNSYKRFKEEFEQPIVSQSDEVAAKRLQKMIRPFILRRLKKDVLKELPDKIEEVVYSAMEKKQREIYNANVQRMVEMLETGGEEEFRTGKIQILAELTKLRQLCCDPSLIYEDYQGGAAKVDTCMELLRSAVEGGHKVLVFSQFTSMLGILKKRLEEEKMDYYLLTGTTSKERRNELVETFNQNQVQIFLISLKAGGTGLNLTAASVVIHFDPWWNMAAQNQATDRAHRIGQRQVVTVYKLIMKDTVEEKIQLLQQKKARLSDQIISEGSISEVLGSKEEFMEILKG